MDKRLPHNAKEGLLYGAIICTLTVLFMSTFSITLNEGTFNTAIALTIIKVIPLVWVIAMVLEPILVGRVAEKLVQLFTAPTDSFHAKIFLRIFFTVFGMSLIMTFIGEMLANGIGTATFGNAISVWPLNFMVVLLVESLVIQPIARATMVRLHRIA